MLRRSTKLTRALANGDSQNNRFTDLVSTTIKPSGDGVFTAGEAGYTAPNRILLVPVGNGPAGSQFQMRLYGWQLLDSNPTSANGQTWMPLLLAEFRCVTCEQQGPWPPVQARTGGMNFNERACGEIELKNRVLRQTEGLYSYPGMNLIGSAEIDLCGCQLFQVDFEQIDEMAMNCFVGTS